MFPAWRGGRLPPGKWPIRTTRLAFHFEQLTLTPSHTRPPPRRAHLTPPCDKSAQVCVFPACTAATEHVGATAHAETAAAPAW